MENNTPRDDTPLSLALLYKGSKANEPITLYQGQIRAKDGKNTIEGDGEVTFAWHPSQRIAVQIETPYLPPETFGHRMKLDLVGMGATVYGEVAEVQMHFRQAVGMRSNYNGIILPTKFVYLREVKDDEDVLTTVVFHIVNFPYIGAGDAIQNDKGRIWLGRTTVNAYDWRFTLDEVANYRENSEQLDTFGGFSITHVGKIERVTGEPFSINSGMRLLSRLSLYMSYVRGHWSSIILPVGSNSDGSSIYREWYAGNRVTNWRESEALARSVNLGMDTIGLHRFLELSDNPLWDRALASAIHWYVESSMKAGGIQGAIVLQMAAFELLAWTLFVQDANHKRFGVKEYDHRPLRDKINDLLTWMKASSEISEVTFPQLRAFAEPLEMAQDGPRILVKIRDAYVHPKPSRQSFIETASNSVINDAYRLGQIYLKETLQKLFGYAPFLPVVRRTR